MKLGRLSSSVALDIDDVDVLDRAVARDGPRDSVRLSKVSPAD